MLKVSFQLYFPCNTEKREAITEITGLLRDFYSRCDSRVNVSKTATAIQNNVSYAVTVSQGEWLKTVRTAKLSA